MPVYDDVSHEVDDDGGMCFRVDKTPAGAMTALVRVWGHITIDGKQYEYDREVRVKIKRSKTK